MIKKKSNKACFHESKKSIPRHQEFDASHVLKNIQNDETKVFEYASDILKNVVVGSSGKAWHDYLDLMKSRFDWVYTHSINVAVLSVMIAAESGHHQKELECIALGGLLHDVGKLLVPSSVIQKESSLDNEQMALVRKHCELGISLVANCGLSDACLAMILQHHERLDGSGYPFGLKSDQIHAYAKIAMIADVLDAITSYRPYRPAKSVYEAIQIIKNEGPKLSAEYVSVIERLLLIRSA